MLKMARQSALLSFVFVMAATLCAGTSMASTSVEKIEGGALTTSPQTGIQIQGLFDPDFDYLDQGSATIKDNKNRTVTINVITEAKSNVNTIGGTVYLQKWTGSAWVNVGTGTTISGSNRSRFVGEVQKSVESGYYYRARVVHYVNHGSVHEQGESTTGSIVPI